MPKNGRISKEEKETIIDMLKSGYIASIIKDKTGRSEASINKIRKDLQLEGCNLWHKGSPIASSIPIANINQNGSEKTIGFTESKPVSINLERKTLRFSGKHSGFTYIIDSESDKVVIRDDGYELIVPLNKIYDFTSELLSISDELRNLKKEEE